MKDPLLTLLQSRARMSNAELADALNLSPDEVSSRIAEWEKSGVILGYQAITNDEKAGELGVSAFIEVKLVPQRGGGFDHLAKRIARFEQVDSCILTSGGYDLMVVVHGTNLRDVAQFVSEKLSAIEGVLSTATHFRLKTYKEKGCMFETGESDERLSVSP